MAVVLTVSETITGSDVADVLAGGSTGLDLGQVASGQYTPMVSQVANTGRQDLFISHDAVTDPITDFKIYIAPYSGVYGGANSPSADFAALSAYGAADTGSTANNSDGLSQGLHMDMSWDVIVANQFSPSREATGQKRIFGKNYSGKTGLSLADAFNLHADACSYYNGTSEVAASAPVAGSIGISTDSVRGNRAHIRLRAYLNTAASEGGYLQYDHVFAYSYTS